MGFVRKCLSTVSTTFSEVNRDCEGGGSGGNVHRCSSCEIKATQNKHPAVGIPRPASNRVVDDGRPDEDEYNDRSKSGPLSETAYRDHRPATVISRIPDKYISLLT